MPLPAGFTAQHYNDIPLFEVSASARAKYRAFVAKAWSDQATARAAFAAQSLSKEDTRYKVARLMAAIFGNEPETTLFGETLAGGYAYPTNEWDHDPSLHERDQGIQTNSGHVPANLVPFPFTTNNPNIRHTSTSHRQIRIYSLSGSMAWPWTHGPVFADLSNVHIEWLLYQGTGTPADSLQLQYSWFSAGERGHAGQDTDPATNAFGIAVDHDFAINTAAGGKIIRENLVPDLIPDPRTIAEGPADSVLVVSGTGLSPDVVGNYYETEDVSNGETVWEREDGLFRIFRGSAAYAVAQTSSSPPNTWDSPQYFRRVVGDGLTGDYVGTNGAIGTATVTLNSASNPIVTHAVNHMLSIRTQVRLANSGQTCAILGGRFVFGNKRGVALEQFSAGSSLNNPPAWITRNEDAIPYWAPIIGAPDVVIINFTTTGGTAGDLDEFYDNINTCIDIWKQANPDVLIILTGNQYSAGLPGDIGSTADYRTHYPSVFRQIALEREDVLFFNITRWLDNRANHTPAHSVGHLGSRNKGEWSSATTYSIGDVVYVDRTAGNSPEARGIRQYYIALADSLTNHIPGITGTDTDSNKWALFNLMTNDDIHPSGELERHRCLAYAQLLSGTFPDRTANELLGLGTPTATGIATVSMLG